jgi:hypothetical protein
MSKEQKLAFIKALKYEGLRVKRADGRLIITRCGELVVMVEPKSNGSVVISRCGAGAGLVKACLYEALA